MSESKTENRLTWAFRDDGIQPVYEKNERAVLGRQLVMTPVMLLDKLKDYQDATRCLRQSVCVEAGGVVRVECPGRFVHRLDRLQADIEQTLHLLWRGGLWMESEIEERSAMNGRAYRVVREPFTDGRPPDMKSHAMSPKQLELRGSD